MALQQDTVSLNMGMGIDQKDDDKASAPNTYADLKDWIFTKFLRLDKRFGWLRYVRTLVTTFPNPLSITLSDIRTSTFNHNDQLLLQNKGALYSWSDDQDKWIFKNHYYPIEVESSSVASNEFMLYTPDSYTLLGKTVVSYICQDTVKSTTTVRYSVIEESTGNYLIDDAIVDSVTVNPVGAGNIADLQVFYFSNKIFLGWRKAGTLYCAEVNLTTGAIGSTLTLQTDIEDLASGPPLPGVPSTFRKRPTFVYSNKTGVGERNFCFYYTNAGQMKVFTILNTGAVDGAMTPYSVAASPQSMLSIHWNASSGNLFLAYKTATDIFSGVLSFTTSAITLLRSNSVAVVSGVAFGITQCDDPLNASQVYVFADPSFQDYFQTAVSVPAIYKSVVSTAAVVTPGVRFGYGLNIIGTSLSDQLRQTIYLPVMNQESSTSLQSSNFLLDILKGKTEAAPFVQAKWNYGSASLGVVSHFHQVTGSKYMLASTIKTRASGSSSNSVSSIIFFQLGVGRSIVDFAPEFSPARTFLAKGTHLSGGYLGYYDGSKFSEHSFFLAPEFIELVSSATLERVAATVIQQGDVGLPEIAQVSMCPGPYLVPSTINNYYIRIPFIDGTNKRVVFYFVINGSGIAPTGIPAEFYIPVNVNGNETAQGVSQKIKAAWEAAAIPNSFTIQLLTNGVFRTSGALNGNVTGLAFGYDGAAPGPAAGSYQYCAVWSWVDVNGQLQRSAPSIPSSITTNGFGVSIVAYAPPITNREASDIQCEIYRTEKDGTTFYKLSEFNLDKSWNKDSYTVGFLDYLEDSGLIDNELLYTTGGVLENYQIPAVKHISTFKNRIIATGFDNTSVYYSKTNIPGSPVEFAAENFFTLDNDESEISGHAELDDKLIIFKTPKIIYVAGDGSNDLGANVSWSQPATIATDVGAVNHNSICVFPFGLLFKSTKGIYLLSRGLEVKYIGQQVEDYNQFDVARTQLLKDSNEVRFVLQGSPHTLSYNYVKGTWSVFTNYGGTDACVWQNNFTFVDDNGYAHVEDKSTWVDTTSSGTVSYSPVIETNWMKIKGEQDFQRIYRLMVLGELKSAHTLNVKAYYDYDQTNFDEYNFLSSNIAGSAPDDTVYQPEFHLKRQKCDSLKLVMTAIPTGGSEQSLTLTDMSFLVGLKKGLNKVKKAKKL